MRIFRTDANMISAANPSSIRRIGPLCAALGVVVSLLFAGLLAFTDAPARADTAGEGPLSAEQGEQNPPAGEEAQWPTEPAPPAPVETAETPPAEEPPASETAPAQVQDAEEAPAAAEETPPPETEMPPVEPPPAQQVEPPAPPEVEAPAPPEVEAPAPVEEAPAPVEEAPAPVEEAPAAEVPAPVGEPIEVPEHEEKGGKTPLEGAGQETTIISSQSSTGSASTPAVSGTETGDAPEVETTLWPSQLPIATLPPDRSKRPSGPAGCGLEASITSSCGVGWLSLSTQSTSPTTVLITSGSFRSSITGTETEDASHRRTSVENSPSAPSPAQGPGGSGGVSAAGGGSSAACSAFASAGIKLCHAEISTRAVILDQPSWRTSFFVLVPERPG